MAKSSLSNSKKCQLSSPMFDKTEPWHVVLCDRNDIRDFVETWHYSKNINGLMSAYCFKLIHNGEVKGAIIYGSLGMAGAWKKYADCEDDVIELRRLCCIDDTPQNTESYFIGKTLRWLKLNTNIKTIVSYADPNFGHQGTIYKATNFTNTGLTSPGRVIEWKGRLYHDKAIRTEYRGEKKPFALELSKALETGEATYKDTVPKVIYTMDIKRKKDYLAEKQPTLF
jgi:hypothetical protein